MARYPDDIRSLYKKKILLDIYINHLDRNNTREFAIVKRTGFSRTFVHTVLAELGGTGLLEVYSYVGAMKFYRPSASGLSMIAGATENERSMEYFLSNSLQFEHPQPQHPSPKQKSD